MSTWSQLYSSLENYFTWLVSSFSLLGTMSSIVSHARLHPRSPPIECFTIPCLFVLTLENTKEGFVVIFVCNLKMDYFVIYVQALASDNGSLIQEKSIQENNLNSIEIYSLWQINNFSNHNNTEFPHKEEEKKKDFHASRSLGSRSSEWEKIKIFGKQFK